MKSITIHNLDAETVKMIEQQARESGLSLNKTIKSLLRRALGLSDEGKKSLDFSELVGLWDEKDLMGFKDNTNDLRKIDSKDWE